LARRAARGACAGRRRRRALRETRARFLAESGWGDAGGLRAAFEERDETLAAALRDRRPVVLWFEHDLYDQLQLLQVLALAARPAGTPTASRWCSSARFPAAPTSTASASSTPTSSSRSGPPARR
jgi:hypothetical protein